METQGGQLRPISELHPSYLPLQYPLLFPRGEDGYRVDIPLGDSTNISSRARSRVTMRQFFAFRIQDRTNEAATILSSRKLFQQFLVDAYTMVESERLSYIRDHQKNLRAEKYKKLTDSVGGGNTPATSTGKRIVLPSSFTGGPRYMVQNYLAAMALCRVYGYPDLFITFTCNPKWPEIKRFVQQRGMQPEDRPDILCRVFKMKLDQLIKDLKQGQVFGRVQAGMFINFHNLYFKKV